MNPSDQGERIAGDSDRPNRDFAIHDMKVSASVRRGTWLSPAKVNLCLRVVGRRPDGYHLLDSVFAAVDLCDEVTVDASDVRHGVPLSFDVRCSRPGVPASPDNVAARAAAAALGERGLGGRVVIELNKRIPPGAGLGGGSGNAATVLSGLNSLLDLRLSPLRLRELAFTLGADVPFFLCGGTARVRGIGEIVDPIPELSDLHLVVAIPSFGVSTAWAFRAYADSAAAASHGDEAAQLAAGARPRSGLLVNDLEAVVVRAHPAIAKLKHEMLAAGAAAAVMSGSGSSIVGVAESAAASRSIASALGHSCPDVQVHAAKVFELRAVP